MHVYHQWEDTRDDVVVAVEFVVGFVENVQVGAVVLGLCDLFQELELQRTYLKFSRNVPLLIIP